MRTGDLLDVSSSRAGGLLSNGVATAALSVPPIDLSTYSQLVQHMASLYRCDPAALAASLATMSSSANHLPLAVTAPHALSSAALASAALSAEQSTPQGANGGLSSGAAQGIDGFIKQELNGDATHMNKNVEIQSLINQTKVDGKKNSAQGFQSTYNHSSSDKPKKYKNSSNNTNNTRHYTIPQDNDGALDLTTQGLRSLYSSYRRINLDNIKPKIIEDLWVENDSELSWTDSKVAAYNPAQKLFMCVDCECVGFLSRVAEHWLGAHANLRVFRCPRCPYTSAWSRCVKMHLTRQHNEQCADTTMWKENAVLMEVTRLMQELRTKVETRIDASSTLSDKRFYCPHCPYATDRRDLYTRHENIHKDDKPFHCYLCYKQFNRADHVKKHFVRMHPDTQYDIAKIRKHPGVRGRGSPIVHDATPPPPPTLPTISVIASLGVTPTTMSTTTPQNIDSDTRRRSMSPLPLTIQNLRVHNMAMNTLHPPSPPSPDITVDVVTPDPIPEPNTPTPHIPDIMSHPQFALISQTPSITITKCVPPSPPSPPPPVTLPQSFTITVQNQSPEPRSPDSGSGGGLFTTESPLDVSRGNSKKRTDRAFRCPYCQWSGSDNWCLKRHMNTHIKPFACSMCEYKAARAERLSTHVLKVHNKRICNKCNFMAETQEKLLEHIREEHHNNPYSRRHTCGICGITLENQTSLQNHLQKAHAPQCQIPPSSSSSSPAPSPVPKTSPQHPPQSQAETNEISFTPVDQAGDEIPSLICPAENCVNQFTDGNTLVMHLQKFHDGCITSRCPHCGYCLTKDELAKDHWLTHHQDVCVACVHVFTSVYGPQLWKKVHIKQSSLDSPLDAIVSGLSRKRSAPSSSNDSSTSSEFDGCDSVSVESDNHDSDVERHCKRSRKQSCPKKVVAVAEDENGGSADGEFDEEDTDGECDDEDSSCEMQNKRSTEQKRKKNRRCLRCPHRPVFASYARLRAHRRNRHRTNRSPATTNGTRKSLPGTQEIET